MIPECTKQFRSSIVFRSGAVPRFHTSTPAFTRRRTTSERSKNRSYRSNAAAIPRWRAACRAHQRQIFRITWRRPHAASSRHTPASVRVAAAAPPHSARSTGRPPDAPRARARAAAQRRLGCKGPSAQSRRRGDSDTYVTYRAGPVTG